MLATAVYSQASDIERIWQHVPVMVQQHGSLTMSSALSFADDIKSQTIIYKGYLFKWTVRKGPQHDVSVTATTFKSSCSKVAKALLATTAAREVLTPS